MTNAPTRFDNGGAPASCQCPLCTDALPAPLPCGCVRGSFLCPTAERLWNASSHAWTAGDYAEYARLRQEYGAHFYAQPAPQLCPICGGDGVVDSGGQLPWSEWANETCSHCAGTGKGVTDGD